MTPNIPLLRKAIEFVEASAALTGDTPDIENLEDETGLAPLRDQTDTTWFQGLWSTTLIHPDIVRRALGRTPTVQECGTAYCVAGFVNSQHSEYKAEIIDKGDYCFLSETIAGQSIHQARDAAQALGITEEQAAVLFDASNTAAEVREIAERIAGEPL